jgi:hypothetical protein
LSFLSSFSAQIVVKIDRKMDGLSGSTSCAECPRCMELQKEVDELRARLNSTQADRPRGRWTASDDKPFLQEYFEYRKREFERSKGLCRLKIVRGNLVDADEEYKVHLVSADMKRSRGVAAPFAEAYGPVDPTLSFKVGDIHEQRKDGTTLLNLVHKDKYFYKFGFDPNTFLSNIVDCLARLKDFCVERGIKRLALVRIASNTEKVHWRWTQAKLLEIFADVDITLFIYLQKQPKRFFHKTNSTPEEVEAPTEQTNASLEKTDSLLDEVAVRLADVVDKGNVGGGSLSMLPPSNRKPPRHPLPNKVNSVGKGLSNPNSSSGPRITANDDAKEVDIQKTAAKKGAYPKKDVAKRDVLPRHLSGGGGTTTPSPPSSEPPLTSLPQKVNSGKSCGASVPHSISSFSMADSAGLVEVISMMRDDMAKIRTEFADLRRSMTPKKPDIPVSPGSSAYVNSRFRGSSFGGKNTQRLVSPLVQ